MYEQEGDLSGRSLLTMFVHQYQVQILPSSTYRLPWRLSRSCRR